MSFVIKYLIVTFVYSPQKSYVLGLNFGIELGSIVPEFGSGNAEKYALSSSEYA